MKHLTFLMLLFLSFSSYASMRPSTIQEVLNGSESVFYGEIISGEFHPIESDLSDLETDEPLIDQLGIYRVKVVSHIAGKEFVGNINVQAIYTDFQIGGYPRSYPAPGLSYIFVLRVAGGKYVFSPYHIPKVSFVEGYQMVVDTQHSFIENVSFYYELDDLEIKESALPSVWLKGDLHPYVKSIVGYKFSDYARYISNHFKSNKPAK